MISKLHQGAFSEYTLYIDSYPLGKSASGEKTRWHHPVVSWAEQESCRQSKLSMSHHTRKLPTTDPQWYILSKMPCTNTSWTESQVAKSQAKQRKVFVNFQLFCDEFSYMFTWKMAIKTESTVHFFARSFHSSRVYAMVVYLLLITLHAS